MKYKHKEELEDYWINLMDEKAIRRRMRSRMTVNFIRKCNIFPIPDQIQDDGNIICPDYAFEKSKLIDTPNWSLEEISDLGIFMKKVTDRSRAWIDKQMKVLMKQGVAFTYSKMQNVESSSSRGHEDITSNSRLRIQGTTHRGEGKELRKIHKAINAKSRDEGQRKVVHTPTSSSSLEEKTESMDSDSVQGEDTEILPQNSHDVVLSTHSVRQDTKILASSPTVHLVVNLRDDVGQPARNTHDMEDDVISALKEYREDEQMDELPTVPDWLRDSMDKKKRKVEEVPLIEDIDAFLSRIKKIQDPKPAKKYHKIIGDEATGSRTLHLAIPTVGMNEDEITPEDFRVTVVDIGSTTKKQEFQELRGNTSAIERRIDRLEAEKEEVELENVMLKEFINQYVKSSRQENTSLVPYVPALESTQCACSIVREWADEIKGQAEAFLAGLVRVHEKTTMIMGKIQGLEDVWKEFQHIKQKVIPRLRALKTMPISVLVQEDVIDNDNVYDFNYLYLSLITERYTYEHARIQCEEIEGPVTTIRAKILGAIKGLLNLEFDASCDLSLDGLKAALESVYFRGINSLEKGHLNGFLALMSLVNDLHWHIIEWDTALDNCMERLEIFELQHNILPGIDLVELRAILLKFVEFAKREKEKGISLLDDDMFDD